MWTTGFNWSFNKEMAQEHERLVTEVAKLAAKFKVWVAGSTLRKVDGGVANALSVYSPEGKLSARYDKTHLFSFFREDRHMVPGASLEVWSSPWGGCGLAICYDLRFPEVFRTYVNRGCVIQLLPAAWPYPRLEHWKVLVRARAIENQFFMVAVNQVGREKVGSSGGEGKELHYFGHSMVVDPWGNLVVQLDDEFEGVCLAELDLALIEKTRRFMTALSDRRPELYEV